MNFTSPETRMIVLPETEDRMIACAFLWTKHWNVTDRQTELSWLLQHLHCEQMQTRCNKMHNKAQNKSSQRPHMSANENMVWIQRPYLDTDSWSRLIPNLTVTFLCKDTSVIKFLWKSDHTISRYELNCVKMPYLAMLKNPFKNSWIWIRRRMTSKI